MEIVLPGAMAILDSLSWLHQPDSLEKERATNGWLISTSIIVRQLEIQWTPYI